MKPIPSEVVDFLRTQSFVLICSIDKNGLLHSSCKDIIKIDLSGEIYLMDVYHGVTSENIRNNPSVNISAVDEHKFMGYCLKGKARMLQDEIISQEIIKAWENNITSRLTKRLLKNLVQDQAQKHHPEASLPQPKQLIVLEVEEIVNLAPYNLRKESAHG